MDRNTIHANEPIISKSKTLIGQKNLYQRHCAKMESFRKQNKIEKGKYILIMYKNETTQYSSYVLLGSKTKLIQGNILQPKIFQVMTSKPIHGNILQVKFWTGQYVTDHGKTLTRMRLLTPLQYKCNFQFQMSEGKIPS